MTSLIQLATIRAGYPFRGTVPESPDSGIGVIQLRFCSFDYGIDWSNVIETAIPEKQRTPWLEDGDVLFAARGGRHYAMTVRFPEDMQFIRGVVAAPHFYILRTKPTVIPEFITWQLNSKPCQQYFESTAVGSYTKSVRREALAQTPLPLPKLEKQAEFVAMSEALTKQRRLLEALMDNGQNLLDAMALDLHSHASRDG